MTNDTDEDISPQEYKIWSAVFATECIVIFIINAFTLIAFARNRNLRKRSTYLIINLTVADLLVGAVTISLDIFGPDIKPENGFSWKSVFILTVTDIFLVASLFNISLISLDRLHATIYSFKHCLIRKWVYFKLMICSWLLPLLLEFVSIFLFFRASSAFPYVFASYIFLTLLILTACCVMIIVNVKSVPHSQHFGSVLRTDKKLSITLFTVTVISFVTILPFAICEVILRNRWSKFQAVTVRVEETLLVLCLTNSIVNPLVYAIRMQQFRKAAKELICRRTPELIPVQPIKLRTV